MKQRVIANLPAIRTVDVCSLAQTDRAECNVILKLCAPSFAPHAAANLALAAQSKVGIQQP